jgi:serpin B
MKISPLLSLGLSLPLLLGSLAPMPSLHAESASPQEPTPAEPGPATDASTQLGWRLLSELQSDNPNLCLSPYSITAALAMTYPGAAGETLAQMQSALAWPAPEVLAGSFRALDELLFPQGPVDDAEIRRANRLFGQTGYLFREPFLHLLAQDFSAPLEPIDFIASPRDAIEHINQWVEAQTNKKIRDLLPPNSLDDESRLVLVNALYFKAPWLFEFQPEATAPLDFFSTPETPVSMPGMRLQESIAYTETNGARVAALPYRGLPYQFLLVLPDGPLEEWLAQADPAWWQEWKNLPRRLVDLQLPKFRLEPPTLALQTALEKLGLTSMFDVPRGSADFDNMAPRLPNEYLFVSGVFHKTFLEIDEKGTEAAAATAVAMMRATSIPVDEPVEMVVNRPFLFAVQHTESGSLLFLGLFRQPAAAQP